MTGFVSWPGLFMNADRYTFAAQLIAFGGHDVHVYNAALSLAFSQLDTQVVVSPPGQI